MGKRALQVKKRRSSSHKGPSSSAKRRIQNKLHKSADVQGPEVLKQGWDKKLTVRQNYAKLGLLPNLRITDSGGADTLAASTATTTSKGAKADASGIPKTLAKKGMARIIRDDKGNVVDVIEYDEEMKGEMTPWGEALSDGEEEEEEKAQPEAIQAAKESENPVVKSLTELSATSRPVPRHTAAGKLSWLFDLVDAHGDDVDAMVRDKRLNVQQKTGGEIRRAIKQAGGIEVLRGEA